MQLPATDRRSFLRGTLVGAAALGLGARPVLGSAALAELGKPEPGKIGDFKVSLAQWSLHRALRAGEFDNLDFPRITREQFGIDAVEFVNQFFKDKAKDSAYLKELKTRADDQGVTCVLIMIDGEGSLSTPDDAARNQAVENHKKWVDAAAALDCKAIRVNTGSNYSPTDTDTAADGCGKLTEYGKANGIKIICENHGGPSSNPDALVALMKAVDDPYFGTLPDFGNFPGRTGPEYTIDIYRAIAMMMPYAHGVSAKSYDFDAEGDEVRLDYPRILKIVTDAGYDGHIGIEYEGGRLSEPEGIKATKALLERLRGSQYEG